MKKTFIYNTNIVSIRLICRIHNLLACTVAQEGKVKDNVQNIQHRHLPKDNSCKEKRGHNHK